MTGERLAWFRVAAHLHLPVEELAERITHSEFLDWLEYLKWEDQREGKDDFYSSLIAAEIRRSYVKHPNKVKQKDFKIQYKETTSSAPSLSGMAGKAIWLNALNIEKN